MLLPRRSDVRASYENAGISTADLTRAIVACIIWICALRLCWFALRPALNLVLFDDRYILLGAGPLVCAALFYSERNRIFSQVAWDIAAGLPQLTLASVVFFLLRRSARPDDSSHLSLAVSAFLLLTTGVFISCYGRRSFRAALGPFCWLLLTVPPPPWAMDRLVVVLQRGSAVMSYWMMHVVGLPVFANEQKLALPGLEIEVAPECSGIRSCLAVILITLVAGQFALRRGWGRAALVLASIPLAVVKNALRISVIAVLGAYVDHAFVAGPIHRYGGLIFTPLEIAALAWLLRSLRGLEAAIGPTASGA